MGIFNDFIEIFRFVDLFKAFRSATKDDVEGLIKILKYGKSKYSRWEAAEALGKIGDNRAVDLLIESLKDKKPLVRWKAAEALGEIKDNRAVEPLIKILNDREEDWSVRKGAAEALGKIGDNRAVEPLIEALKYSELSIFSDLEHDYVRWGAEIALGWIGDKRAVEPLIEALKDEDGYVRKAAGKVLEEMKSL